MESFVAQLLSQFETGRISRRQLVRSVTVAAAALRAGVAFGQEGGGGQRGNKTPAQEAKTTELMTAYESAPMQAIQVSHFRYTCKDYKAQRDYYQEVMGWHLVPGSDNGSQCKMAFYPKGETPVGQEKGTPSPYVIFRNGWTQPAAPTPGKPNVVFNHIAYTVQLDKPLADGRVDWESNRRNIPGSVHEHMRATLSKRELSNIREDNTSFHVRDAQGYDLQISGVGMNGYTG